MNIYWMITYTCARFIMWSVTSGVIMNNGNAFPLHGRLPLSQIGTSPALCVLVAPFPVPSVQWMDSPRRFEPRLWVEELAS